MLSRTFLLTILLSACILGHAKTPTFEHTEIGVLTQEDPEDYQEAPHANARRLTKLSASDENVLLKDHNDFRSTTALGNTPGHPSATNMEQMIWDPALATVASNYANKCLWKHNGNRGSEYSAISSRLSSSGSAGENLYISFRSSTNSQHAIKPTSLSLTSLQNGLKGWYDEYTQYNFNTRACSGVCGHYTQVVWDNSRYVGCGYALCATATNPDNGKKYYGATLLVCNYSPPGNFGRQPYTSGTKCSSCPANAPNCNLGQCTASTGGGGGGTGTTTTTTTTTSTNNPGATTSTSTTTTTTTTTTTQNPGGGYPSGDGSCNAGLTGTMGFYFKNSNAVCLDYAKAVIAFRPCVGKIVSCVDEPYPGFSAYRRVTIRWVLNRAQWGLGFNVWRNGIKAQLLNAGIQFTGAAATNTPPADQGTLQTSSNGSESKKSDPAPIIIGVVFGLLAVCCVVGGCFWFAQRQKQQNSQYKMMQEQQAGMYHPPTAPIIS